MLTNIRQEKASGNVSSVELNTVTQLTGHGNRKHFISFINAIFPTKAFMEEVTAVDLVITQKDRLSFTNLLNLSTFLISNNLVDGPSGGNLYEWIKQHGCTAFLDYFISISMENLSSKALIENLFRLAVEAGDTQTIDYLLWKNVRAQGHKCQHNDIPDYLSPLQYACISGNIKMARILIDHDVQIEEPKTGWKRSLLVIAIIGYLRANKERNSGNMMHNNGGKSTRGEPLQSPIIELDDLVNLLIGKGARVDIEAVHEPETDISAAEVEWRDIEEEIEDLPVAFLEGHSPLTAASKYHCQYLVDLFIDGKADVNYVTNRRTSALQECLYSWEEMWSEFNGGPNPLSRAISRQSTAIVQRLLDNKADVNCCAFYVFPSAFGDDPEYYGLFSALDLAITSGALQHVQLLLDGGAKLTDSSWHNAMQYESFEMFEFLLLNTKSPIAPRVVSMAAELDTQEKEWAEEILFDEDMLEARDIQCSSNRWMNILLEHRPDYHTKKACILEATALFAEMPIWAEVIDSGSLDSEELREVIRNCCKGGLTKPLVQILNSNIKPARCTLHDTLYWTIQGSFDEEIELVDLLLHRGADAWPVNGHYSPLLAAIKRRQKTVSKRIIATLSTSARFSRCCQHMYCPSDEGGWASTWIAAFEWGEKEVLDLLANYYFANPHILPLQLVVSRELAVREVEHNRQGLYDAIKHVQPELVWDILVKGLVDIHSTYMSTSFLFWALQHDSGPDFPITTMLVHFGADPDGIGTNPWNGTTESVLTATVRLFSLSKIEFLLRKTKVGPNKCSLPDITLSALQIAVCGTDTDIVKMLLEHGANPDIFSPHGNAGTPLQLALNCDNLQFVEILLEHDADPNTISSSIEHTPLQIAASKGHREIVETLISKGAHVNAPPGTNSGATALQFAAIGGFLGLAILLLEKGAQVDAPPANVNGRTALEGAAEHGRIDMVKLLLSVSETGSASRILRRAMDLALQNGHYATLELIELYVT